MSHFDVKPLLELPDEATRPALPVDQLRRLHALDMAMQAPYLFLGDHDELSSECPLMIRHPIKPDQIIDLARRFDEFLLEGH